MDEIYIWVRQISMMAILSFLTLYLVDGKEKKQILRFLLSLFLLLIVMKPFSAVWNLEALLEAQLELFSDKDEVVGVQAQIDSISQEQEETLRKETEKQILLWIREILQGETLIYEDGKVCFSDSAAENGLRLESVEISVRRERDTENRMENDRENMDTGGMDEGDWYENQSETEKRIRQTIAEGLSLDENAVMIRWRR